MPPRFLTVISRREPNRMQNIIAGRKPIVEALRAEMKIEKILLLEGTHGRILDEIRSLAAQRAVAVETADEPAFRSAAGDAPTQGVIALLAGRKEFVSVETMLAAAQARGEQPLLLILDEIEDPQNLGALVRTAECAGFHGIIIPRHHAATVTPAAVKASAGATVHMAMAEVTNIAQTISALKAKGIWVAGLEGKGEKNYTAVDYTPPTAIVVGNEGRGMRRLVREHCDHLVRIPLYGKLDSLNASVAGALAMFEAARQRHPEGR